jgi:hypothetical protein
LIYFEVIQHPEIDFFQKRGVLMTRLSELEREVKENAQKTKENRTIH